MLPAEKINLHFTGDFHAITSAHNLLSAMLDAHIHHGNELRIDVGNIAWPRTMDMNDRALRQIVVGLGGKANGVPRETGFVITAASEIMAILALASSREDLRRRIAEIVVGYTFDGQPVRAADLKATGAMMVLLNEAIMPNLVQTTEGTPALVHAGPFANIAHGTSSIISQRIALSLAEFVVNETGFGADLGAEKYFDVVMPTSGIKPAVRGADRLGAGAGRAGREEREGAGHRPRRSRPGSRTSASTSRTSRSSGVPIVVAINRFHLDTPEQTAIVRDFCRAQGRARRSSRTCSRAAARAASSSPRPWWRPRRSRRTRSRSTASTCRSRRRSRRSPGRSTAPGRCHFDGGSRKKLQQLTTLGFGSLPVCMAKTQSSITDNPKVYGAPTGFTLTVNDVSLSAGAGFVVVIAGNMMRMPGLGKVPQAVHLDVNDEGEITGLR